MMPNSLSKLNMPPFYTMEMMKYAAEMRASGKMVYHLEVGQPIVATPGVVLDEAVRALREDKLSYCSALGLFELREAIAEHYQYAYGLTIDPETVVITPGSSLGLYIGLLMNFEKGAKIAIAAPSYPCYRNVINSLEFEPVEIITTSDENYLITPENLAAYGNSIAGVLIASPNNPTGSMYTRKQLKDLCEYCEKNGIYMLSDELYHGITYGDKADTVLQFNPQATVISGFSKYFAMTGWRIGWMIVPKEEVRHYESLLQNLILCTSSLTQIAATKVFSAYAELDQHVRGYKENLDILHNALTTAGLTNVYKPNGAFYLYVELEKIKMSSMDFCKRLLHDQQVAVAPGMDFSSKTEHCTIRLSFCQSKEIIQEGANRISLFINSL
jgi:aspartate/methionine/tyrosine aminotransferase